MGSGGGQGRGWGAGDSYNRMYNPNTVETLGEVVSVEKFTPNKRMSQGVHFTLKTENLEAQIDPRFERAPYFLLVDLDTMECQAVPNQASTQGAGIQAAAMVASHHPAAVLTGNCGPNAFKVLKTAGISVIVGITGRAKDAVQSYRTGNLKPTDSLMSPVLGDDGRFQAACLDYNLFNNKITN
jgi:predicted Fe-Mo cluster-binding NifX family protein